MSGPITSPQNQWIRRVRRAIDRHESEIALEGPKMIRDAIALGWTPIVTLRSADRTFADVDALAVDPELFGKLAPTDTPQGCLALFARPTTTLEGAFETRAKRIVALDAIQDPGNVGTIIRTAAAFEATAVVCLEGTADPWSPKAVRASAGAVLSIPVVRASAPELIELAARENTTLFAARLAATTAQLPVETDLVVVLGNEGRGVSASLSRASEGVRIPMSDRVESLNVASAAAILLARLYEQTAGERP